MIEHARSVPASDAVHQRERLLRLLSLTTFIVFFQGYMVAPNIPLLSTVLHAPEQTTGLIVPAYLIPYGVSTLVYGLLADRIGIHWVMFASLAAYPHNGANKKGPQGSALAQDRRSHAGRMR